MKEKLKKEIENLSYEELHKLICQINKLIKETNNLVLEKND